MCSRSYRHGYLKRCEFKFLGRHVISRNTEGGHIARLEDVGSQRKVREAVELAGRLHAADRRQREPYLNHLLRVALRIICHYDVRDADIICAALLHDAVEDHANDLAVSGRPGAFAVLAASFAPQVASLVEAVTNPDYAPVKTKTSGTGRMSWRASSATPAHA
jgi:(p)ppGpp synthase/HD superfamily hydrolase